MQVGRDNDPRGAGVGSLFIDDKLRYSEDKGKEPPGPRTFNPDHFILGT